LGRLPKLTDADVDRLESLGIQTVVSLLTVDDIEAYGRNRLPAGVREVSLAIDSGTATRLSNSATAALKSGDFSQIPVELNPEIHRILVHDGQQQYAALLREITNPANHPLVFHCSHGVHRTGTGAAILLSALGVPWETVREDYLLSNNYRQAEVEKRLGQLRQLAAEKQDVSPEQVDMTNMEAFLIQQGSYIDASRDEMVEAFGSVDNYIRAGLGLSQQEISHLQNVLLY
jgi:protein-tyrosine phosphatase